MNAPHTTSRSTNRSAASPARQPKGQPTGGQFAAKANPECNIELSADTSVEVDGIAYEVRLIAHRPGCRAYRCESGAGSGWAFEYDPNTKTAVGSPLRPTHPSSEWLDRGEANITHVVSALEPEALFVDLRGAGAGTYAIGGPSWPIHPERYTGPFTAHAGSDPVAPVAAQPPDDSALDNQIRKIFPNGETLRHQRGHDFLTKEIVANTPPLYETENLPFKDKVVTAHYFSANGDWYITELDPETGEFFGCCDLGMGFAEWGYESLRTLESVTDLAGRPAVERDLDFRPQTGGELHLAIPATSPGSRAVYVWARTSRWSLAARSIRSQ